MMKKIALIVIGMGILTMLVSFIDALLSDSDIPSGFRIGIAVVMVGCLILVVSIGLERYRAWKGKDKDFDEVK